MTILVLAPHADDEVLGMGGTMARLADQGKKVVLAVLTGHGEAPHPLWPQEIWDRIRAECRQAAEILGVHEVAFRELPAACLDHTPSWQTNQVIAEVIQTYQPTEIYVPFAFDLHQDHGAVAYGASVAGRPYLPSAQTVRRVLAYETLSETHLHPGYIYPAFQPNVFVDISDTLQRKLDAMAAYESQVQPAGLPRSLNTLEALATLRGAHIGRRAAEAFVLLGEYDRGEVQA